MSTELQTSPSEPSSALLRWCGRLLLAALLVLVGFNLLTSRTNSGRSHAKGGREALDFSVRRIDAAAGPGSEFHLTAERGHPVLVDFWATWCGPCKESLPILDQVHAHLQSQGLRAIAVETEASEAKARAFAAQLKLQLPLGVDESGVSERYGVTSIPYMVLIDAEGQIRRVFHGVHSAAEIERAVFAVGLK